MSRNIVTFHYTLRDSTGRMLDMSVGGEPVAYMEGAGQIIDGLEEQLRGLSAGAKTVAAVPAARAYGERDPALLHKVKRALLPIDGEVRVGDQFRTGPDPMAPVVTVASVDADEITLDANHPLAGVDLTFHVEVVSVREATAEEIETLEKARQRRAAGGCGCGKKRGREGREGCDGNCDGDDCGCDESGDCDCGDDCDCESGGR